MTFLKFHIPFIIGIHSISTEIIDYVRFPTNQSVDNNITTAIIFHHKYLHAIFDILHSANIEWR